MKTLRMMLMVSLLALPAVAAESKHEGFGELSVDQVANLVAKKDADVFDNNGKDDFKEGHVPTAKWVAFNQVKESDLPQDHSRKLVFYCANSH